MTRHIEMSKIDIKGELDWFYNKSALDAFGIRSDWASLGSDIHIPYMGQPLISDGQIKHINKYRTIRNALNRLPTDTIRKISSVYDHEYLYVYSNRFENIHQIFGNKTGLVLIKCIDKDMLYEADRLCKSKLAQNIKANQKDSILAFKLGDEIDRTYNSMHAEYKLSRGFILATTLGYGN